MPGVIPQKFAAFNDTTTTSTSLVCTYSVNSGDCVVVIVGSQGINAAATGVADTGGNAYTLRASNPTNIPLANQIFVSLATTSATSITVTWTAGTNHTVTIGTYTGVSSVGSNAGTINNPTGTTVSLPITLASPANFAVGALTCGSVAQTNWVGNIRQGATATLSIRTFLMDITGITSGAFSMILNSSNTSSGAYIELIPITVPGGIRPKLFTQFYTASTAAFPSSVIAFPIAIGDCVVVFFNTLLNATVTSYNISDDGANVYTQQTFRLNPAGNGPNITAYSTIATAAATQLTLGINGTTISNLSFLIQSYLGVGAIGVNFGSNTTGNVSQTLLTISGTLASVNNLMVAGLVSKTNVAGSVPFTVNSGILRAYLSQGLALGNIGTLAQSPFIIDNTGVLSPTCAITLNTANVNTSVFFELVPFPPSINTISPASGNVATTVPVTISGLHFNGATAINLSGTGITVNNLVVVNDSTITANFVIASGAPLGSQQVSVTTPGGTSGTIQFTVVGANIPIVNTISPSFGFLGTTIAVTITGMNFVSPATVQFTGTGVTASNVVVVNSTTITANVTIAPNANIIGRTVSVTTLNGTSSPPPFIVFGIHFTIPRNRAVIKYGFLKRKKEREIKSPHTPRPKRG